ncbi:ABC transporter substrate-binding protein [Niallia sp.]|uniref:ABC transporter substrate-binding protein n=1 Tax=Niallia sp. TaxID=2837523 RepID=UPI0037C5886E
MVNPPIAFNPINSSDVASQYIEGFMFDSLLDMPESLKFTPKLAESFETTDNQTYTIKINKNANWSDGNNLNNLSFIFNMERMSKSKSTWNFLWCQVLLYG